MVIGGVALLMHLHFDLSPPYAQAETAYLSRQPRPVLSYGNVSLPFPPDIWVVSLSTVLLLAAFFFSAHSVYSSAEMGHLKLARRERFPTNFFIFSFAKITEPGTTILFE